MTEAEAFEGIKALVKKNDCKEGRDTFNSKYYRNEISEKDYLKMTYYRKVFTDKYPDEVDKYLSRYVSVKYIKNCEIVAVDEDGTEHIMN